MSPVLIAALGLGALALFAAILALVWISAIEREVAQQTRRIADLRPKAGLRTGPHPRLKAIVK